MRRLPTHIFFKQLLTFDGHFSDTRWILTSRDYVDIRRALIEDPDRVSPVSLQADLVDRDINSYVDARIHTDKSFQRWTNRPDDQSLIITSLMEKSCGMFRWAACQLDDLAGCLTLRELKNTLARLPTTLPETYSRMLQKIPPARIDGAIRLLQFLMLSPRPLELGVAANILAMNIEGDTLYDTDKSLPDLSELALYCPGLIMIVHFEDPDDGECYREELQLSHYSVKEYLLSNEVHEDFRVDLSTAKASSMATVLLLRSFVQWSQSLPADLVAQERGARRRWMKDNFPLAEYATYVWTVFATEAELQDGTQQYIVDFLADQSRLNCLLDCSNFFGSAFRVGPMYIAVEGGLLQTATALLRRGFSSRVQHSRREEEYSGWKDSPLAAACRNGHQEMVNCLLEEQFRTGVDDFWGAATAAARQGYCHILELLFEKVPHWRNLERPKTQSPIHVAVCCPSIDVVKFLLDKDFDVNLTDVFGDSPIFRACERADIAMIQFLFDH
ncbi:hypothetical protein AC578_8667 [Pseudocercospora eumusae]|uniref:Uncharacterized protein n=1 Tax=Pseudocercospora eumusae TaxID=321146 RepID=A0A139HPU1_9PEZI|nr:hypothetical protein AC578_8667 [Pseudocercospora eumusae]